MAFLRGRVYLLLITAGLAGLFGMMMTDMQVTVAGGAVAATAEPRTGMKALTDGAQMDGFGSFSPDGRQIVFMRDGRIWLMAPTGDGERAVTDNAATWDALPAWRPDGKQIAFARLTMNGETAYVMMIDPATKAEKELAGEREPIGAVAWDPSGASVYYTTPQRLVRVDLASGKRQQVLTVASDWEMLAGGLVISRDGKQAIFGAGPRIGQGVKYDLWAVLLRGGKQELQQLTRGGGIMPSLDQAGKRLVYRNPRSGTGIYVMDLATHATEQILSDERGALYFHPSFSPDGRSVLISRLVLDPPLSGEGKSGGKFTSHLYLHTLGSAGRD